VDDLQFQTANVKNIAVFYSVIDFDGTIPIFVYDCWIGKSEAFARPQVKIFQNRFGGSSEPGYVLPTSD
jgi:hypothetical protein